MPLDLGPKWQQRRPPQIRRRRRPAVVCFVRGLHGDWPSGVGQAADGRGGLLLGGRPRWQEGGAAQDAATEVDSSIISLARNRFVHLVNLTARILETFFFPRPEDNGMIVIFLRTLRGIEHVQQKCSFCGTQSCSSVILHLSTSFRANRRHQKQVIH